jgi:hypothetical protein
VKRAKSNRLGEILLNYVNVPVFLLFSVFFSLTKNLGMANRSVPPPFSIGFWFDDLFAGSTPFLAMLLAMGASGCFFTADKKTFLMIFGAIYAIYSVSAIFTFLQVKGTVNIVFAAVSGLLSAVHASAFLRYSDDDDTDKKKACSASLARTAISVLAAVVFAAAACRLLLGVDDLARMPAQVQVAAAVPAAAAVFAAVLLCGASDDVVLVRAALHVCMWTLLMAAVPGNVKPGFLAAAVQWAARAGLLGAAWLYAQAPVGNALRHGVRQVREKVVKIGNMQGYGEE